MNRKKVMAATLVIVLIVGGIIWYNASRNAKDAARYAEGVEALDAGRYTEAMTIFNDLKRRGFNVDVGLVECNYRDKNGKMGRKQLEVDFVLNQGSQRYYIQSALTVADPEKRQQEIESLIKIPDSFRKIVVVKDYMNPWRDDNGILYIGVQQFLLDETAIDA